MNLDFLGIHIRDKKKRTPSREVTYAVKEFYNAGYNHSPFREIERLMKGK